MVSTILFEPVKAARRDKAAILGIPGQVGSIPRGSVPMDGFIWDIDR